ncbi:hypothetical protein [Nocardioides soli]|uniref:HK97 gp10 family phage protein n=1 Tax=Nocardioides soli TaxID=1036020 RepID=A0A7W4VSU3_9ACTN|nr:hypothetical protein [Nocardioides soli]MBB3041155.1 hypothetical protein [Nocardioides soli]
MARAAGFKVEGLNSVVRALQQLGADVEDLKDVFSEIAATGADIAADHIDSDTGRAASTVRGNRAKNKAVVAAGSASVPYLGVINYGWPERGIEAQEFMQSADDQLQPIAVQLLEDGINAKIKEKNFR